MHSRFTSSRPYSVHLSCYDHRKRTEETPEPAHAALNACHLPAFCYTRFTMSHLMPIDISNMPDLVRIAEEEEATNKPRVLKRDNTPLAILTPVKKKQSHHARTKPVKKALPLPAACKDLPP